MSFEHLSKRGWTHVPDCKRVRGSVTIGPQAWTALEEWARRLDTETRNERLRPKHREMAQHVLHETARLFREMGFVATTGTDGLRVYERLSPEEQSAVRRRIEEDDTFYEQQRISSTDYYSHDY